MLALVCWTACAFAQAYDYGFDIDQRLARRHTNDPFVVDGLDIDTGVGHMPVRQEIRAMETQPELWTLYLLSLSMMQYTNQSELLSYYQIAGIHGVPWNEWNGVVGKPGSEQTGYCAHVSVLFATWHRPYLALYEMVLYDLVQYIASLYPANATRKKYESAAANFRIPYMDWAAQPPLGESVLPDSVGDSPVVQVSGPNGVQTIANPLYAYLFKPLNASMFLEPPYDLWETTVRSPTTYNASAVSNNTRVSMVLNQNLKSIQLRLYNLFSNYNNFTQFSNEAWITPAGSGSLDSLESLHDTIHILIGLLGHMSLIPFSSYDPIFFLHHAMVDRVFALWQILNPSSWIVPTAARTDTFTISTGQMLTSQTPLTPFYKNQNGTFWNSDDVRDMGVFGYTYDDMLDFPRASLTLANATTQAQAKALINELYGSSIQTALGIAGQGRSDTNFIARKRQSQFNSASEGRLPHQRRPTQKRSMWWSTNATGVFESSARRPKPLVVSSSHPSWRSAIAVDNQYREWVVNIHTEKQALGEPYVIHLFLGELPTTTDYATWAHAPNLVGSMGVFASPASAMGKAVIGGDRISGTVPLTLVLAQLVFGEKENGRGIADLEPETVKPYLMEHLHCAVIRTNGVTVPPESVAGLGITVASAVVQVPASAQELPRWGEVVDILELV